MNISLKNKVIVITGSSRGIGRSMGERFVREGANVVINYHSNEENALEILKKIKKGNYECGSCVAIKADVTKENEVMALYQKVINEYNRIDVLVNNAGKCNDNYVQFMSLKQWNYVVSTNLTGAYICSRIFSKNMIANRNGKIINISSLKGQVGSEGQCNYSASKAGVIGLTKSLAKEMGKFGVSVNAICPGFIVTDLNRYNKNKAEIAERMSILKEQRSLEDFLNFVTMLCSDYLVGISGQVFNLDSRIN